LPEHNPNDACIGEPMLKLPPVLSVATAGLFFWFVVAFMSDNNTAWTTSQPVQVLTGLGT
jgi:hypothetical protein